jgi:putative ATP-dependent endonuclease of the OLD family
MRVRMLTIRRFRGIEELTFFPTSRNVLVGPNNAGKSTVLEALDLALHPGVGRPRAVPTEVDYYDRDPGPGFEIEVVVGDLSDTFLAESAEALEGWRVEHRDVVPELDGVGIEPCIRLRVRGLPDLDVVHEHAKPELAGARFGPRLRTKLGWVFDGRQRDPSRQLAFYQGGVLDRLFADADLDPALTLLREALGKGAESLNADPAVAGVLEVLQDELSPLGLEPGGAPDLEAGAVSNRELLQALRLAMPGPATQAIPLARAGRGTQRLVLLAVLLMLARRDVGRPVIGGFEEPEEAVEPLRQVQAGRMIRELADSGGQVFVSTHSPDVIRSFDSDDLIVMERTPTVRARRLNLTSAGRHGYERRLDWPLIRGLFLGHPVVVEGVSDRVVFTTFWDALADATRVPRAERVGLECISAEGNSNIPMALLVLKEMGKVPVALVERDQPTEADRILTCGHARALLVYPEDEAANNLERLLAASTPLDTLAVAMDAVASDRGDDWGAQRADLVARALAAGLTTTERDTVAGTTSLREALAIANEAETRRLVALCLAAREPPCPFEIKGGRNARVLAESIASVSGVPDPFARALEALGTWIAAGSTGDTRIDIALS